MIIRLALIVILAVAVFMVMRWIMIRVLPRLASDPRIRAMFSGVGLQLIRLFVLRRGLPVLWRLFRSLRFFRF